MTAFQCRSCHRAVTRTVAERPLPAEDVDEGWYRPEASPPDAGGHSALPIVRMPPGTFAIDPDPSGPPYVLVELSGFLVEAGPHGTIVLNPSDSLGLEAHPDIVMRRGYCCGMDGEWGPNLACTCGEIIATLYSDCYQVQELRLQPDAVDHCA